MAQVSRYGSQANLALDSEPALTHDRIVSQYEIEQDIARLEKNYISKINE